MDPYPNTIKPRKSSYLALERLFQILIEKLQQHLDRYNRLRKSALREEKIARTICLKYFFEFAAEKIRGDLKTQYFHEDYMTNHTVSFIKNFMRENGTLTESLLKVELYCCQLSIDIFNYCTYYQFCLPEETLFFEDMQKMLKYTLEKIRFFLTQKFDYWKYSRCA